MQTPDVTRVLEADVCIVGSGIAGTLLALKLAARYERIIVIERGPRYVHGEVMARAAAGTRLFPGNAFTGHHFVNVGRHRHPYNVQDGVGGSTWRWWGHALRLGPNDFRLQSAYGVGVDWPIDYEEIEPWYCAAEDEIGVSGAAEHCPWPRSRGYPLPGHPLSAHEKILVGELAQLGVRCTALALGRRSRAHAGNPPCCGSGSCSNVCPTEGKYTTANTHVPRAEGSGRVHFVDSVRANHLVVDGQRIREVHCIDLAGAEVRVRAGQFALAANAIENARLLLASAAANADFRASPATGRYFMDHPNLECSGIAARDLAVGLGPTPSNGCSWAFYDGPFRAERAAGLLELMNLRVNETEVAQTIGSSLTRGLQGEPLWADARPAWRGRFRLGFQMELPPSADNRITLSLTSKDPWGFPIIELAYDAWPDYVARAAAHIEEVYVALGRRLQADVRVQRRYESRHLSGTCRMGTTLEQSVVDRHLRHHAYDNLRVLGSAVFPTIGAANPTVLIAALSLRCAANMLESP